MNRTTTIGMIGLDTSHVSIFSRLLNDPADPHHVPGGKVIVGFPGGSDDFELSRGRVEKFTSELKNERNVEIVNSLEAVAEKADVIFIESVDGRVHRQQFDRVIGFGKPIFVDKPMALRFDDARYMFQKAAEKNVPLMSASSLRYFDVVTAALGDGAGILGCDVFGPMELEPTQDGLFWYGIHSAEMLVTAMGVGCEAVQNLHTDQADLITCRYRDGRIGTIRGVRKGHQKFGMILHRADGMTFADPEKSKTPYYASLLQAIMKSLPNGRSAIPAAQTLEIIRILEAANQSRRTGQLVTLPAM